MTPRLRIALVLFCLAVLALLAAQVVWHGPMLELDQQVSNWFAAHRQRGLTQAMLLVSDLHQTAKVLAATVLVALAFGQIGRAHV